MGDLNRASIIIMTNSLTLINLSKSVINIDFKENGEATHNVILDKTHSFKDSNAFILSELDRLIKNDKLDAVLNAAGGWVGGNLASSGQCGYFDIYMIELF